MFEVGFHARAWSVPDSLSSLKSYIILSVVNLERREVLIPILHIRSWKNVCIKPFLWNWEHLSKILRGLLLIGVTPVKWQAVHMIQISSWLSQEKWRGTKKSFPSQMEAIRDSCMSRYVACEYICEKICAVSSSAELPFRGGLSTAQRPDGLEVTPTAAGILSPLSKYLYHLQDNP